MTEKGDSILTACLALAIGLVGGYAIKSMIDKGHADLTGTNSGGITATTTGGLTATSAPPGALSDTDRDLAAANQMIAPDVWRIYINPLWKPAVAPFPPATLPSLGEFPAVIPKVKTIETEREMRVTMQVPGLTNQEIDVKAGKHQLAINGKKAQQADDETMSQTVQASFEEIVQLPCAVDASKAKATMRKGELTVWLPKEGRSIAESVIGNGRWH